MCLCQLDFDAEFRPVLIQPSMPIGFLQVDVELRITTYKRSVVDIAHIHYQAHTVVAVGERLGHYYVEFAMSTQVLLDANSVCLLSPRFVVSRLNLVYLAR